MVKPDCLSRRWTGKYYSCPCAQLFCKDKTGQQLLVSLWEQSLFQICSLVSWNWITVAIILFLLSGTTTALLLMFLLVV